MSDSLAKDRIHDLIIVGGGPGGYTAGIYAKRAALDTLLIEKGVAGGQLNNTSEVENWPGIASISGAELAENFARHGAACGLTTLNREVTAIRILPDHHQVTLDDGVRLKAHALILATGGSPKKLGISGENEFYGRGVSYCAVCDGFFYRNKTVVVVGGGNSALEEALYLAKIAKQIFIAHRRDSLRGSMILQQRIDQEAKITVLWNTVLERILADSQGVNGVITRNTLDQSSAEPAVDGVFVFIGFAPNNSLVPSEVHRNDQGFVLTDERCATNVAGIFAIGDLKEKFAKQIVTAAADGCTAALAASHYIDSKKV